MSVGSVGPQVERGCAKEMNSSTRRLYCLGRCKVISGIAVEIPRVPNFGASRSIGHDVRRIGVLKFGSVRRFRCLILGEGWWLGIVCRRERKRIQSSRRSPRVHNWRV